jgi:pimeloyl-ACP methyl ester carboxylesterase
VPHDIAATRYAVLLHGLARSARSMRPIERALRAHHYEVLNLGYASRHADVATLAADVAAAVGEWNTSERLDFVTHSLGGIVLRAAVANGLLPVERVRRVVMLGPPNRGSELADVLPTLPIVGPIYARWFGPAGRELGTGPSSVPSRLPAPTFEVGVIAGTKTLNPLTSRVLGGENDGTVRVDRALLDGVTDTLLVPHSHSMLMMSPVVLEQTLYFLDSGHFRRDP